MNEIIIQESLFNRIIISEYADTSQDLCYLSLNNIPTNLKCIKLMVGRECIYTFYNFTINTNILQCLSSVKDVDFHLPQCKYFHTTLSFVYDNDIALANENEYSVITETISSPIFSEEYTDYLDGDDKLNSGRAYLCSTFKDITTTRFYHPSITLRFKPTLFLTKSFEIPIQCPCNFTKQNESDEYIQLLINKFNFYRYDGKNPLDEINDDALIKNHSHFIGEYTNVLTYYDGLAGFNYHF